jgi:hypothetical protein
LTPERLAVKQQQQPAKGSSWPETIECYLGPTNSGKTYRSLDFLVRTSLTRGRPWPL